MTQLHPVQNERTMLVTTVILNCERIFADQAYARLAVEVLYRTQSAFPFFLYAFVVMPDHVHFLVRVPEGGSISRIMQFYKKIVSFDIGKPIWQPRFDLRLIDYPAEAKRYIHQNPVRAHLCTEEQMYPWSSASGRWDVTELSEW